MDTVNFSFHLSGGVDEDAFDVLFDELNESDRYTDPDPRTLEYRGESTCKRPERIDVQDVRERFLWEDDPGTFWVEGLDHVPRMRVVNFGDHLDIAIDMGVWEDYLEATNESVIDLVSSLHTALDPRHTRSLHSPDSFYMDFQKRREEVVDGQQKYVLEDKIGWLTIFGEEGVRRHGREELLTAPAWRTEALSRDDVLVVLTEDPRDFVEFTGSNALRTSYNSVLSHLEMDHVPRADVE